MRKQTTDLLILLILLILCGIITVLHFLPQPPPVPDSSGIPAAQPYLHGTSTPQETPFSRDILRTDPIPGLPAFSSRPKGHPEKIINKTLPKLLADKEGSYTNLTDLLNAKEPRTLDLNSNWLATRFFPNRTLPLMRMRVLQDPATGEYRISGGALALPGTGLEAGYEAELNSDERKATLQWKKSF